MRRANPSRSAAGVARGFPAPFADRSVASRVAATEAALAAGYTGLRVVVDATSLAATVGQRVAYAHYEYLLDRQSSALPLATICAYDLDQLGGAAAAEMESSRTRKLSRSSVWSSAMSTRIGSVTAVRPAPRGRTG